jgi:hypothetical protein
MNKRIIEKYPIDSEILAVTSATTLYSKAINMEGIDEADFILTMPAAGAGAAVVITIVQGTAATQAQSSNAQALTPACTTQVGSTVANYVYKANRAKISISSAATDAETIIINDRTYTISTANATTSLQFGCTDGTTGGSGPTAMAGRLSSLINSTVSTIGVPGLSAALTSAASTTIDVWVNDTASTSITLTATGGGITPSYGAAFTKVSVKAEALNSSAKYLSAVLSSCATAGSYGLTVIKKGSYGNAKPEHGIIKNHKAT